MVAIAATVSVLVRSINANDANSEFKVDESRSEDELSSWLVVRVGFESGTTVKSIPICAPELSAKCT